MSSIWNSAGSSSRLVILVVNRFKNILRRFRFSPVTLETWNIGHNLHYTKIYKLLMYNGISSSTRDLCTVKKDKALERLGMCTNGPTTYQLKSVLLPDLWALGGFLGGSHVTLVRTTEESKILAFLLPVNRISVAHTKYRSADFKGRDSLEDLGKNNIKLDLKMWNGLYDPW